jgi:hypothetical protein
MLTDSERKQLREAAGTEGVALGTLAHRAVVDWLERRI